MKTLLKTSLCLNLALAGGLVWLWRGGHKHMAETTSAALVETRSPENAMSPSPPPAASRAEPTPFRWSQLEASDYAVYVRNLRAIGCPEWTLRAIVSADVYAAYDVRIRDLEEKLSDLRNGSWTNQLAAVGTETALKSELNQIPDEEAAEINDLLGLHPAPAPVARRTAPPRIIPASMPLVLQPVDPAALGLNSDQIQVVNELRQNLLDKLGGSNPDPNDPANLERLQQAQPEADDMLQAMLGTSIYQNYQLAAFQNEQLAAAGK